MLARTVLKGATSPPPLPIPLVRTEIARPFRAKLRRSFATVQDTPVRRYGGFKDQDRIFTNAYCRRDHDINGATAVSAACPCCPHEMTGAAPLLLR